MKELDKEENVNTEDIINTISTFIKDSGLSADKLCLYVNDNIGKKINDHVRWVANKYDLIGGVVLDYDYGIINIEGKNLVIVVSYKMIDKDSYLIPLDNHKHKYTPYCLNLSSKSTSSI